MSRIKVPIIAPPYPSLDGIELDKNTLSINDGYIDEAGFLVKRPGLLRTFVLPTSKAVDGISTWLGLDLTVAVSDTKVYTINNIGTITDISTTPSLFLQNNVRPIFTFTKIGTDEYMAVSNGGSIFISVNGGDLQLVSDTQAPTASTHIAFVNKRLVSNQVGSDTFKWSNFEDPFTWDVLGFATAEGESDEIVALGRYLNEIVLFGSTTIQFFYATGESNNPFENMSGTELNQGIGAPYGHVFDGEESAWYFIDSERNINKMINHQFKSISAPIDGVLGKLSTISDARFDIIKHDAHKFIICSFPTDNVTYVFDVLSGYWCKWGKYNEATAQYNEFLGSSVTWTGQGGEYYIGSTEADGRIFTFDRSTYLDNLKTLRTSFVSGWIDTGTTMSKNWKWLVFKAKRQSGTGYTYQIRCRKDYEEGFSSDRVLSLSNSASKGIVQRIPSFGQARVIQFEFYHTEDSAFIMGSFELEYTQNRT